MSQFPCFVVRVLRRLLGAALVGWTASAGALVPAVPPGDNAALRLAQAALRQQLGNDHGGSVGLVSWSQASPGSGGAMCAGTMLSASILITAAHCLEQAYRRPDIASQHRKVLNGMTVEYVSGSAIGWAVGSGNLSPFTLQGGLPVASSTATAFGHVESYVRLDYLRKADLALAFVRPGALASGVVEGFRPTAAVPDDGTRRFLTIDPNAAAGVTGKIGAVVRGYNSAEGSVSGMRNEGVFTFLDPGLQPWNLVPGLSWRSSKAAVHAAANLPNSPPGLPNTYNTLWQRGAGYTVGGDSGGGLVAPDVANRPVLLGVTSFETPAHNFWTPLGPHRTFIDQALDTFALFPFADRGVLPENPLFASAAIDDGTVRTSRFEVDPALGFPYLAMTEGSLDHHVFLDGGALVWGFEMPDGLPAVFSLQTERDGLLVDLPYTLDTEASFVTLGREVDNFRLVAAALGDDVGTVTLGMGLTAPAAGFSRVATATVATELHLRWLTPSVSPVPEPAVPLMWIAGVALLLAACPRFRDCIAQAKA